MNDPPPGVPPVPRWLHAWAVLTVCAALPLVLLGAEVTTKQIGMVDPQGFRELNQFMTISAILLGFTQFLFVFNFAWSLFRGKVAGRNPWHSNTLEWTAPSPPPHGNFETTPIVRRGPYEYSVPGMEEDYLPQTAEQPAGLPEPVHAH